MSSRKLVRIPAALLAQAEKAEFNLYAKEGETLRQIAVAGQVLDPDDVPMAFFFTERENLSRVLNMALKLAKVAINEAGLDLEFRDHLIEEMAEMLTALNREKN